MGLNTGYLKSGKDGRGKRTVHAVLCGRSDHKIHTENEKNLVSVRL